MAIKACMMDKLRVCKNVKVGGSMMDKLGACKNVKVGGRQRGQ